MSFFVGTVNVIAACLEQGVRNLILTSSVDAMVTCESSLDMDESAPYPPASDLIFRGYGSSKQKAEQYVLACSGSKLPNKGWSLSCFV